MKALLIRTTVQIQKNAALLQRFLTKYQISLLLNALFNEEFWS